MSSVADLYLQKLLDQARDSSIQGDPAFKLAHAEGACAVFRDLRMMSPEEDLTWRRKFRENFSGKTSSRS